MATPQQSAQGAAGGSADKTELRVAGWQGESYRMDLGHKDPNYGTPMAGTKTDKRGRKAATHVSNEIIDLVEVIYRIGMPYPGCIRAVSFGYLFQIYTAISNKVRGVGVRDASDFSKSKILQNFSVKNPSQGKLDFRKSQVTPDPLGFWVSADSTSSGKILQSTAATFVAKKLDPSSCITLSLP